MPEATVRPGGVPPNATRFDGFARSWLLRCPGIGPGVIQRLEGMGVLSLDDLASRGVDRVVAEICDQLGTPAWANRRSALFHALAGLSVRR